MLFGVFLCLGLGRFYDTSPRGKALPGQELLAYRCDFLCK